MPRRSLLPHGGHEGAALSRAEEPSFSLLSQPVRKFIRVAAESAYPALLTGETGSGKTHIARLIHRLSPRSGEPLVHVNCASVPEALFEREMFGHVRGAFTDAKESQVGLFEAAHGGTLFLDEVGELPLSVQPKLLRVLEEGSIRRLGSTEYLPVDVRLILATNQKLEELIRQQRFREDLFYRCSVLEYQVPPLRRRTSELPALVFHLLEKAVNGASDPPRISDDALDVLRSYRWPGNVRELENALHQAVTYAQGGPVEAQHLPERVRARRPPAGGAREGDGVWAGRYTSPDDPRREIARIREALREEKGNRTRAARRLGMARSTLWAKMKEHRIA